MSLSDTLKQWGSNLLGKKPLESPVSAEKAVDELLDQLQQLDVDEVLTAAGKTRSDLRKVEADDAVSAAMDTRFSGFANLPIRVEPVGKKSSEFVKAQLEVWKPVLMDLSYDSLAYGYAVAERNWAQDGKQWVIDRFSVKPFEWFRPMPNGDLLFFDPETGMKTESFQDISMGEKVDYLDHFLLARNRADYRNPRGRALLAQCYWAQWLRSTGWRFFARFLERNASPLLVGKSNDLKGMLAGLQKAVQSSVMAISLADSIESVGTKGGGEAYHHFIDLCDRRLTIKILGQTMTTDTKGGGAYASSLVGNYVREDRKQLDIGRTQRICQVFADSLIKYNFFGADCRVFIDDPKALGEARAKRDRQLYDIGVRFNERYFRGNYDLEEGEFSVASDEKNPQPKAEDPELSTD